MTPSEAERVAPVGWARLGEPSVFAIAVVCALAAAGWAWMLLGAASLGDTDLGPGMGFLEFDRLGDTVALCVQALGLPSHGDHGTGIVAVAIAFSMWAAMSAAMMLPSAAPMIATYSEIVETAMRGGRKITSVLYLMAGYSVIWLGFSLMATFLQIFLFESGALTRGLLPVTPLIGAGALFLAGAYQFSSLKQACLTKCRKSFSFFFANWREHPSGIFGLGVRQGLACLGCCWALMLVMFATGLMNLVWMAILGIVMSLEKIVARPDALRRTTGVGLMAWGATLVALALF